MSAVLARLTVTPLLWACGLLLAAVLGLSVALVLSSADASAAEAGMAAAVAQRGELATSRDAWELRAAELLKANTLYGREMDGLAAALELAQGEVRRLSLEGEQAIAAARADAADADRTLEAFLGKFQAESRQPTCARALQAMANACPALEDY